MGYWSLGLFEIRPTNERKPIDMRYYASEMGGVGELFRAIADIFRFFWNVRLLFRFFGWVARGLTQTPWVVAGLLLLIVSVAVAIWYSRIRTGSRSNGLTQDPPSGESAPVACHHCQHVQMAPANQETIDCVSCGAHLRRKSTPEAQS